MGSQPRVTAFDPKRTLALLLVTRFRSLRRYQAGARGDQQPDSSNGSNSGSSPPVCRRTAQRLAFGTTQILFQPSPGKPKGEPYVNLGLARCVYPSLPPSLPATELDVRGPVNDEEEYECIISLRHKTVADVEVCHPVPHLLVTFDDGAVLYVNGHNEQYEPRQAGRNRLQKGEIGSWLPVLCDFAAIGAPEGFDKTPDFSGSGECPLMAHSCHSISIDSPNPVPSLSEHFLSQNPEENAAADELCRQCGHPFDAHRLLGHGHPPTEGWMECPVEGSYVPHDLEHGAGRL